MVSRRLGLVLLALVAFNAVADAIYRVPMFKTSHPRSAYKNKLVAEYLKQKYVKDHKFNNLAYNEGLSDFENGKFLAMEIFVISKNFSTILRNS